MSALPAEHVESLRDGAFGPSATAARRRIVVILPRGEAIRNFIYTGTVDRLARHADVTLLTVFPNAEYRDLLASRSLSALALDESPERWIVRIHRELLEMAHGRWLWSEAAKERWRRRDVEADTLAEKGKRLGKKLACFPFANAPGLATLSTAERVASRWFRTSDHYLELFRRLKPSLVFNASHVHSRNALQAVEAANWLRIPTATFLFSWDNLTSQGRILPPYDHYLVWNRDIAKQLLDIYPAVTPEQVTVTGTPQFDFLFRPEFQWSRDEFCRHVGANPAKPIVLYSTGMANHMPGEPQIVERIAGMLRQMTDLGPPQLMVRVYPKDLTGRFESLKARCRDVLFPTIPWEPSWLTPAFQDSYLLTNMLRHSAVGVNVASTVSLELCMTGRPAINVAYTPLEANPHAIDYARYYQFDHYRPVVESGSVTLARSEDEMQRLLREMIINPRPAVERGRAFVHKMFGDTLDGRSGERVADALLSKAAAARTGG